MPEQMVAVEEWAPDYWQPYIDSKKVAVWQQSAE